MFGSRRFLITALVLAGLLAGALALPPAARAQAVTDDWASVKLPDLPEVKAVTVDPKTTALVVMDFNRTRCTPQGRVRCPAALPHVAKLLAAARAHGMMVVHTMTGPNAADISPEVAPQNGESVLANTNPDKFDAPGVNLEKMFKDKGIVTLIFVGTAANGAVIQTASEGTLRGFKAIVPMDAIPGDTPFTEAYTAFHLTHAPTVSANSTLTKVDLISFGP